MFWKRRDDLFRVTTNLILFCETGVLDRELNLTSIPYMGSPEGLRHCYQHHMRHPDMRTRLVSPDQLVNSYCCLVLICLILQMFDIAWRTTTSPLSIRKDFGVVWIRMITTLSETSTSVVSGWTFDLRTPPDMVRRATSFGGPTVSTNPLSHLSLFCVISPSQTFRSFAYLQFPCLMFMHIVSMLGANTIHVHHIPLSS